MVLACPLLLCSSLPLVIQFSENMRPVARHSSLVAHTVTCGWSAASSFREKRCEAAGSSQKATEGCQGSAPGSSASGGRGCRCWTPCQRR